MIVCLGTTPAKQRTMTFASLAMDAVNRAAAVREYASGKSINAARVIHTLGEKCIATGFLGDQSGEFCRRDLDAAGIAHDFVTTSAATRTCITLIDRAASTATELVEEANAVSAQEVDQLLQKLGELLREAKVLVMSGTLAPGCGDDFYARCVRLAQTMRVKVVVDAKGEPLKQTLVNRPTLVKPNRTELSATVDRKIESEKDACDAIRQIIDMGAMSAIVTNGPGDTIACDGKNFWRIYTPHVKAISPIGSGDALAGGSAIGLLREMPFGETARLGVASATANAMTDSAGLVHPQDVEQLQKTIQCVQI